jgi:hypothetical protein
MKNVFVIMIVSGVIMGSASVLMGDLDACPIDECYFLPHQISP